MLKKVTRAVGHALLMLALIPLGINVFVISSTLPQIDKKVEKEYDCILVLGCAVNPDGTPSDMLHDRVIRAVELYNEGAAPKILMSGDHGSKYYNEVAAMKELAVENGVPPEDIFLDHSGFSTYESVWRASNVFGAKKVIVVTQKYHLFRAVYIADKIGLEAVGMSGNPRTYITAAYNNTREILARCKDFVYCITKPVPEGTAGSVSLAGNGNSTNDFVPGEAAV